MKLLFDLLPVIVFFGMYQLLDIYVATGAAIVVTALQVGHAKWRGRQVDTVQWVALGLIVVFGGATLLAQDETFIKWKPSVLYWFMGAALWLSMAVFRRNLLQKMMGAQLRLPSSVWRTLNVAWIGFFGFMGLLNLFVAYGYSTATWVNFKLFGGVGLMLLFVLIQGLYLSRYLGDPGDAAKVRDRQAS